METADHIGDADGTDAAVSEVIGDGKSFL